MTGPSVDRYGWWRALRESGLTPTARHVALAIGTYMDADGGGAFPSMATLAADTGRSRRTVARAIDELAGAGFVKVTPGGGRRADGGYLSNRYRAALPAGSGDTHDTHDTRDTAPGLTESARSPSGEPFGGVSSQQGAVSSQQGAVTSETGSGVTHGTRGTQYQPRQVPKHQPTSTSARADGGKRPDPFDLGRRLADHVTQGRMTRQDAVRSADVYGHEDRARFLEGLRSGGQVPA